MKQINGRYLTSFKPLPCIITHRLKSPLACFLASWCLGFKKLLLYGKLCSRSQGFMSWRNV